MPPPSLSVAAICAQLGARLPVPFCPACGGGSHTGMQVAPTQTERRLCSDFSETQTQT